MQAPFFVQASLYPPGNLPAVRPGTRHPRLFPVVVSLTLNPQPFKIHNFPSLSLGVAWAQIERCKLGIRDAVRECEASGGDKAIAEAHFDGEDGEIDQADIFCAKCLDPESYEVCRRRLAWAS